MEDIKSTVLKLIELVGIQNARIKLLEERLKIPLPVFIRSPCIDCEGMGKVVDEEKQYTPLANKEYISCTVCDGYGFVDEPALLVQRLPGGSVMAEAMDRHATNAEHSKLTATTATTAAKSNES